jgi:serine/threonine protein kinase
MQKFKEDPAAERLYKAECRILRELQGHPHIAELYHMVSAPPFNYMAFELCPGGDMQSLIERN